MIHYGHFLSAPALSWDAKLNMTNVELKLISDPGMYFLFGKVMRSTIFYLCKRCSNANNKKLKSYNPKQESN